MKPAQLAVAVALLSSLSAHAAEKHPWAGLKLGSYVKWESTSIIRRAGAPDMKTVSQTTQTLVERTARKVVIEIEQSVPGTSPLKNRFDLPFETGVVDPKAPKPGKTGSESITVAGKAFPCTWSETVTGDGPDSRTTMRVWMSEAMPGAVVKSVSRSELGHGMSSEMTTVVVDYLAK